MNYRWHAPSTGGMAGGEGESSLRDHRTALRSHGVRSFCAAIAQNGIKDAQPELPRLTGLGWDMAKRERWRKEDHPLSRETPV